MNGIKNYLVKHGEGELEDLIERERNKVRLEQCSCQFNQLDGDEKHWIFDISMNLGSVLQR